MGNRDGQKPGGTVYHAELQSAVHGSDAGVLSKTVRRKQSAAVLNVFDRTDHGSVKDGSVKMTSFEERVLRDLGELKAHMRWIVGNGNEGKMQELENRIRRNEASLQRTAGIGLACGVLLTILHLALDSMKVIHPRRQRESLCGRPTRRQ